MTPTPAPIRFGLQDRVVIVTGAAQGIGEACARRFAREGAKVVIAARNADKGAEMAARLGATFVQVDVRREADIASAIERASAFFIFVFLLFV